MIALRRSGHHAVINWIMHQLEGNGCFLNDCMPDENPFASCQRRNSITGGFDLNSETTPPPSPKDYIIYNFEDRNLTAVPGQRLLARHDLWIGSSRRSHTILVLRDVYNLFASKLRWAFGNRWPPDETAIEETGLWWRRYARGLAALWKQYALEFLGVTNHLERKIPVNYNHWCQSEDYRRQLSADLDLRFHDRGFSKIARWGPVTWGHSFDGLEYDGRAQEMKLTERWKYFYQENYFTEIFANRELVELSDRIFGNVLGQQQTEAD